MRISRIATSIVASLCGLLVAVPASAQPLYPPGPPRLTVRPAVVEEGDTVTVTGRNFGPFDRVTLTVRYRDLDSSPNTLVGRAPGAATGDAAAAGNAAPAAVERRRGKHFSKTVRADARGRFTTRIRLKEDGIAIITAVGRPSGIRASARVVVLCDDDNGHDGGYGDRVGNPQSTTERATVQSTEAGWVRLAAGTLPPVAAAVFGAAFSW